MVFDPFTWRVRTERSDVGPRNPRDDRPGRPTTSRFAGTELGFLARWYQALAPRPIAEINQMTPREVAAVLGLDVTDLIAAVPWSEPIPEPEPAALPARTIRRVVGADG